MKGKCDSCNKKATTEWLNVGKKSAYTLKFCGKHKPDFNSKNLILIYGK